MQTVQPQELALTMFGSYLRAPGSLAWSGGMVALLAEFGFSTEAARAALSRLAARDLIGRRKHGRRVFYELTPRAVALLEAGDRRIFSFGDGEGAGDEGRWTVLWHSLPESLRVERARLGRRLRFLGFGPVQDGTWVAAHDREADVVALLESLGIRDHASLLVGRPSPALRVDAVVGQAWDLAALDATYAAFLADFEPYGSRGSRSALADREAFLVRTRAMHLFRGFPFLDPELPDALMPRPQLRPQVVRAFHALYRDLEAPAARHFAATAAPSAARSGDVQTVGGTVRR